MDEKCLLCPVLTHRNNVGTHMKQTHGLELSEDSMDFIKFVGFDENIDYGNKDTENMTVTIEEKDDIEVIFSNNIRNVVKSDTNGESMDMNVKFNNDILDVVKNDSIEEKLKSKVRFSNDMRDAVSSRCKICHKTYKLKTLLDHVWPAHKIKITEYRKLYGKPEIIEEIFHECGICQKSILLDTDKIAGHAKIHKMAAKEYNEKFMITKSNQSRKSQMAKNTYNENDAIIGYTENTNHSLPFPIHQMNVFAEVFDNTKSNNNSIKLNSNRFEKEDTTLEQDVDINFVCPLCPVAKPRKMNIMKHCKTFHDSYYVNDVIDIGDEEQLNGEKEEIKHADKEIFCEEEREDSMSWSNDVDTIDSFFGGHSIFDSNEMAVKEVKMDNSKLDNSAHGANKTKFAQVHLDILIPYFEKVPQPTTKQKLDLVKQTGLTKQALQRWFDNRRFTQRRRFRK